MKTFPKLLRIMHAKLYVTVKVEYFLSVRLLSVLRGHSFFSSPTSKGFSIPDIIHYIYFPILILEEEPVSK